MNLMREQHFRRNCARHTISVASARSVNVEQRKRRIAERREHIMSTPDCSVRSVCVGWPAFFRVRLLRMETVAALLLIMLGGCKEERPVAEAPTPLGMQRIAVAASPAEGWCHEHDLVTDCHSDFPRRVGRTLLIVEALRPVPKRPDILVWAPRIPIHYLDLGGIRVRCIKTGVGPNLVLLHTLRTQLDMFEKIIPGLEKHFTVHAFDYPGHGWSDIPNAAYAPEDFYQWTAAYLDKLDIWRAAIVGSLNRRNVLADAGGASESARREGHRRQSLRLLAGRRHSQELSRIKPD